MWPKYLDIQAEDCPGLLRRLELEAYSTVVNALRAQGDLTKDRRKILSDLSGVLNISIERHKTEIRRALNDELLATVAKTIAGPNCENEWSREGRRIIPLLRRAMPITAFTDPANAVKQSIEARNLMLKTPMATKTHTPRSRKPRSSQAASLAPPPLSEIVQNGGDSIRPPTMSTPVRPRAAGPLRDEVVVLPSGLAIRVRPETPDLSKDKGPAKNRRKRKTTKDDTNPDAPCESYEVLPTPFTPPSGRSSKYSMQQNANAKQTGVKRRRTKQTMPPPLSGDPGHGYAKPFLSHLPVTSAPLLSIPQLPRTPVVLSPSKIAQFPQKPPPGTAKAIKNKTKGLQQTLQDSKELGQYAVQPDSSSDLSGEVGESLSHLEIPVTSQAILSTTSIQLKDGMRLLPAGTRILPKPGVVTSTGRTPVFMITTSAGQQNVMKVARAATPVSGIPTQRMVTLTAGALRGASPRHVRAGAPGTVVRTLQPRFAISTSGTLVRPVNTSRPSMFLVQTNPKQVTTLAGAGQRIFQTKDGKPVAIVSSAMPVHAPVFLNNSSSANNETGGLSHDQIMTLAPTASHAAEPEAQARADEESKGEEGGGVIVVGLDQQPQQPRESNVLSDILEATGIVDGSVQKSDSNAQAEVESNGADVSNNHEATSGSGRDELFSYEVAGAVANHSEAIVGSKETNHRGETHQSVDQEQVADSKEVEAANVMAAMAAAAAEGSVVTDEVSQC